MPGKMKKQYPHKYLYKTVHSSTSLNSQKGGKNPNVLMNAKIKDGVSVHSILFRNLKKNEVLMHATI